jgi:hypothetical protein
MNFRITKGLMALISIAFVVLLFTPSHVSREYVGNTHLLWNSNTAFLFVERIRIGRKCSMITSFFYRAVGRRLSGLDVEIEFEDLLVFKFENDAIAKFELNQFGQGGEAYPWQGSLYFSRGSNSAEWPMMWRWSGDQFVRLSKAQALNIVTNSPQFVVDILKLEGWQKQSLYIRDGEKRIQFRSQGVKNEIILIRNPNEEFERIAINQNGKESQLLIIDTAVR